MGISQEESDAIMAMSEEELLALDAKMDQVMLEAEKEFFGEQPALETPAKTPQQQATSADVIRTTSSTKASLSAEQRKELDELNAIMQMSDEEAARAEAKDRAEFASVLKKLLGEEKPTDTTAGKASLAQSATPPQKQQPRQDIWTVKPGQSAACLVPHEVNPRHRSPQRRYRDKEVPHGFPVANLREFFFYSRRIASAAYDAPNRRLFLKFDASTLYQYFDVPEKVARDLLDMVSPGSYASRHICYSFKYERVAFSSPQPTTTRVEADHKIAQANDAELLAAGEAALNEKQRLLNEDIKNLLREQGLISRVMRGAVDEIKSSKHRERVFALQAMSPQQLQKRFESNQVRIGELLQALVGDLKNSFPEIG